MSQEEINRLSEEEKELLQKLESIRESKKILIKKEEEKKLAQKEIVLQVKRIEGNLLIIEGEWRPDVEKVWKSIKGHVWQGYGLRKGWGKNGIPISQKEDFIEKFSALPNLTITWEQGLEEDAEWHLNAPPWEITVGDSTRYQGRFFLAKPGPNISPYSGGMSAIPGFDWDYSSKTVKIPLSEGWRIYHALEKIEGVVYSDEAKNLIFDQVQGRSELDQITKKEDSDFWDFDQNGITMRPFQRVGVEFIAKAGGRVILADATGLGKTWQTIAFAEYKRKDDPTFLTICAVKAANIPNWEREIERLTGTIPVVCSNYPKQKAQAMGQIVMRKTNYVIISHDMLGTYDIPEEHKDRDKKDLRKDMLSYFWVELFKSVGPDLLIIDEAHQIKNPDAHRSYATRQLHEIPYVIPATASPVLNRTNELWPLLFMVNPEMFKSGSTFETQYTVDGKQPKNVEKLHELIRPVFLRRKKKDVLKDLPAINRIQKIHELSDEAKADYELVLAGIYRQLETFDPRGQGGDHISVTHILSQIMRLKQICAADKVEFTADLATQLIDESEDGEDTKVLIFSQFKGSAHAIAQRLGHQAVCTVVRKEDRFDSLGAIERDNLFEDARHDKNIRFIVTTEAAKEGHNLEFCDFVIFNDPLWTPAGHDQCEGRAYGRLSNPHPIDSFYIVANVKIEHWIYEMLDNKLAIIDEAVEGVEASRDIHGSIAMDLIKKMKEDMWGRAA